MFKIELAQAIESAENLLNRPVPSAYASFPIPDIPQEVLIKRILRNQILIMKILESQGDN